MKRILYLSLFILCALHGVLDGSHYRGGIISWRPLNNTVQGTTAQILLHQRYFWYRLWSSFPPPYCTEANVVAQTPITVSGAALTCLRNCTSSPTFPSSISANMITSDCDTNTIIESWSGELYTTLTLPLTTSITIGYTGSAWLTQLYLGGSGSWAIVNRMNLAPRPDGYINSSPVTSTLPCILYQRNVSIVHIVPMADNDATDILFKYWNEYVYGQSILP
ncbi:unnamed protein product [Adineta steineri]|uniref:Uncharacterized protein n=1 Tax=Adineta steineri TaxID=433720 RepID=A0A819ZUS3_9BILA|nr:unnamed protein product [Adineta steineri]